MQGHGGNERRGAPGPLEELTATLWCAVALLAAFLAVYWLTGAIYSD